MSAPKFIQEQLAFAAHIRDPEHHARPADIEERRMAIYRELFYNNIAGFIETGFPVLQAISSDAIWHRRIRAFFSTHRCQTPYFAEIGGEFLAWLQERGEHPDDPPFILELAHYEWVELALSVSDADKSLPTLDHNGDLVAGYPVISPVAWHLSYQYPVHQIGADFQPEKPGDQPTYLVVYRDRQDKIHFMELNPVTYRLMDLLSGKVKMTGQEALQTIAEELQHPDPAAVIAHGVSLLEDLRSRNIIIGSRSTSSSSPL